MLRVHRQRT